MLPDTIGPIRCPEGPDGEPIDHEMMSECSCTFWCGEGSEAGCCACVHSDIYEPCPAVGFGCGVNGGCTNGDEDCCTPEQQTNAALGDMG